MSFSEKMSSDVLSKEKGLKKRSLYSTSDYKEQAEKLLDPFKWSYIQYGNERSWCLDDSVKAFSRYRVRSRVLQNVSDLTLKTTVLGERISTPICVAPTGFQVFADADAEKATAKGSAAARTIMVQSIFSSKTFADVAASAPGGLRWVQIYPFKDRLLTKHIIKMAERAGYKAVVVTVDSPCCGLSKKLRDVMDTSYVATEPKYCLKNAEADIPSFLEGRRIDDCNHFKFLNEMAYNLSVSWNEIEWMKSITSLPVVCKGILTAESARVAADTGIDGIIVSAHGGRQLDGFPAPIDALSEVVQAVSGRGIEVYMDGGIRTGTDVFKALGRGARAVFVGRPVLWGLACEGAEGVKNVLDILSNELETALRLGGCRNLSNIAPGTIVHESFYHSNACTSKL